MGKLESSGYRGWWELKLFQGKGREPKQVFRNMLTGEVYDPGEKGWDGEPPYPTGELVVAKDGNTLYRMNYDQIRWYRDGEDDWRVK